MGWKGTDIKIPEFSISDLIMHWKVVSMVSDTGAVTLVSKEFGDKVRVDGE